MGMVLKIAGLKAEIAQDEQAKAILHGIDLDLPKGEIHAVMGPNGSGKSTLSYVLAGKGDYRVTGGEVSFEGQDLLAMTPEERARAGVFLAFQSPIELPGVNNATFLRTAVNAVRRARGEEELNAAAFLKTVRATMSDLGMTDEMLKRNVNVGFSGGEKKRNEVLQMRLLNPRLAIMDETDSGLDIDALRVVAESVNRLRGENFSALIITHHQRLLDYIKPDRVHVLAKGRVIHSGSSEVALALEAKGYAQYLEAAQ